MENTRLSKIQKIFDILEYDIKIENKQIAFINNNKHKDIKNPIIPWTEKYKPNAIDNLVGQETSKKIFNNILINKNIPNILLYGPTGSGKNSAINALCRGLYGPMYKTRIMELNAADQPGINTIRSSVKDFVKSALSNIDEKYDAPDKKILIFDEADSITGDAQLAMRKIIENYANTTAFIFICNHINKITDPIKSRCSLMTFKLISNENVIDRLKFIADKENISNKINSKVYEIIADISNGDMREAISLFQSLSEYCTHKEYINKDDLYEHTGIYSKEKLYLLINMIINKELTLDTIHNKVKKMIEKAYSVSNIMETITEIIANNDKLTDVNKALININIVHKQILLSESSNEFLNLLDIFYLINSI